MTAKVYAIANRKGGVGKTTTTGALASGLGHKGAKVLLVDCDPQGDSTNWRGIEVTEDTLTLGDVLKNDIMKKDNIIRDAIIPTKYYDIIPSGPNMFSIQKEIDTDSERNILLRERLDDVMEDYDFIVMDTPPALSVLTINSFMAAKDGIILVTDSGTFATKGMSELADEINKLHRHHPHIRVIGILATKFNSRSNFMKQMDKVTKEFASYFEDAYFYETHIRQSVGIMESQGDCTDFYDEPKEFAARQDYVNWVDEFLNIEMKKEEQ